MDSILGRVVEKGHRADATQHARFRQAKGGQISFCPSPVISTVVAELAPANASSFLIDTISRLCLRHCTLYVSIGG